MVDVVQLVRASDCGSECRRFEPDPPPLSLAMSKAFFCVRTLCSMWIPPKDTKVEDSWSRRIMPSCSIMRLFQLSNHHRFHHILTWPLRHIEQGARLAAKPSPVDASHIIKVRRTEIKRASKEHYGSPALIYPPLSATIRAFFSISEKVAMQAHTSESQHPVFRYNKLLIHDIYFSIYFRTTSRIWRLLPAKLTIISQNKEKCNDKMTTLWNKMPTFAPAYRLRTYQRHKNQKKRHT